MLHYRDIIFFCFLRALFSLMITSFRHFDYYDFRLFGFAFHYYFSMMWFSSPFSDYRFRLFASFLLFTLRRWCWFSFSFFLHFSIISFSFHYFRFISFSLTFRCIHVIFITFSIFDFHFLSLMIISLMPFSFFRWFFHSSLCAFIFFSLSVIFHFASHFLSIFIIFSMRLISFSFHERFSFIFSILSAFDISFDWFTDAFMPLLRLLPRFLLRLASWLGLHDFLAADCLFRCRLLFYFRCLITLIIKMTFFFIHFLAIFAVFHFSGIFSAYAISR